jgi:diaminohydroxyphosphoribosylaminopyrimidine deaminase / 5-amino-6-(5-phosphoribosylamino)uracil reductase
MNRPACRYLKGNSLNFWCLLVNLWSMPPRTGSEPRKKDVVGVSGLSDDEWRKLLDLAGRARVVRSTRADELLAIFNRNYDQLCAELTHPLARRVYAPLIARIAAGPLTIAQVGQSLDGRIATESGHSHYINGEGGLDHLHRLRALADAVVVGATTVALDNPRLTTRRVPGPSPVRVIIDPNGRVPAGRRVFDAAAPTLSVQASQVGAEKAEGAGRPVVVPIQAEHGLLPPCSILRALHERGLLTILIEGGGTTISAFLTAAQLHRLHVVVAPMLIGPGRTAFHWPAIDRLNAALRFSMTAHQIGQDVLFDCVLDGAGSLTRAV